MKVTLRTPVPPPRLPRPNPAVAALLSVLVGLYIAIGELDHLLGQLLDVGRVWSVTGLSGPTGWGQKTAAWRFFRDEASEVDSRAAEWLVAYGVLDCLLVLCYTTLLLLCLVRLAPRRRTRIAATGLLLVGAGADLVENLLIAASAPTPRLLVAATTVKWLALAPGLLLVAWLSRRHLLRWLRLTPRAVYTHRYSVLVVLPLALLGLARGPDLLEQLPDIQRAWVDEGGFRDFVWAGLVMGVLVVAVFVIGRQRTHHLWQRTCSGVGRLGPDQSCDDTTCPHHVTPPDPHRKPLLAIWFAGPALLALTALIVEVAGGPVSWGRLLVFCALPLAVGVVTLVLRLLRVQLRRPERAPISRARFDAAAWLGDVLVGLLPVVAGLGAIRAFTAVLALDGPQPLPLLLFTFGWLSLLAAWWALDLAVRGLDRAATIARYDEPRRFDRLVALLTPGVVTEAEQREPEPQGWLRRIWQGARRQWLAWTVLLVALLATVLVGTTPVPLADNVGVIATFQLALGAFAVLIAALVVLFQPGGAPEAFWKLRIAFVPITTLLVLAGLLAVRAGGGVDVHGIRTLADRPSEDLLAARPTMGQLFDSWLLAGEECASPLPDGGGLRARPLLLYAAEGGGIRAAYWTGAAIDRLARTIDTGVPELCRGAFLSSGASGGSVGLSIASVVAPGEAGDAVRSIAGPQALGAAADGMLRDTIFAATGLPLPSLRDPATDGADWSDRGTLIEHAWEGGVDELAAPYLQPRPPDVWDWGPAGALVVNSTSTTTSCRTLISQLRLPGDSTTECAPGQPAPGSTDLLACSGQLRTTTAALLTARFPYVTPSGVVSCEDELMQVVDGGYAENTGVGTLVDVAPRLVTEVRAHNHCVLDPALPQCAGEPALDTLVVPQLVYFDNGTGSDLIARAEGLDLELLVPPVTILSAKRSLYSARSQLERAQAAFATDQLWPATATDAAQAAAAVDEWRGNPVAVVYQATKPAIAAPLGWVLSEASVAAMDDALCSQATVGRLDHGAVEPTTSQPQQFGTIDDVLELLPGRSVGC